MEAWILLYDNFLEIMFKHLGLFNVLADINHDWKKDKSTSKIIHSGDISPYLDTILDFMTMITTL